jgi:O-antigen/teichoic acid export membrane protein
MWMLLNATVSLGSVLSVGTSAGTIKEISASRGRAGQKEVERIIRSSLAMAFIAGSLLSIFILAVFLLGGDVFFSRMGDRSVLSLTAVVAAVLAVIDQVDNVFASALKGAEQFGRAARIEMAGKTMQVTAAVLAVMLWGSLIALYFSLITVATIRLIGKSWAIKSFLGLSSVRPCFNSLMGLFKFARWAWLQGAGGAFFGIADRMVIGALLGATSLAHYSVAMQLAQQIHGLSAAALSVVFPVVSRKLSENERFPLGNLTKMTMGVNFLASGILAFGLMMFGRTILSTWLGEKEAEASTEVLWYLSIAYWLLAINVAPHFILLGVGRIQFVALSNLTAGMISFITIVPLARIYGLSGVAMSRIVYGALILANCLCLAEYLWRKPRESTIEAHAKLSPEGICGPLPKRQT